MQIYRDHLADLAVRGRLRALAPARGVDFTSNDYLGLAASQALRDAASAALARGVPLGSGGSRLLRGNHSEHLALEAEAARQFGAEAALFFATGFAANTALFATLPQRGDLVLHDAAIHASAHDGMRLGRAGFRAVPHGDAQAFEAAARAWRRDGGTGRLWIAVETLYSMDGDRAPLDDLVAIADRHDAMLILDEAHATGVFGARGEGLAAALHGRENVVSLHTCGKALGCEGALLCGPAVLRDFLVNRARGLIFSPAPSPLMAAVARASLAISADARDRRARLSELVAAAATALAPHGVPSSGSQILPLILGEDRRAMAVAATLQRAGFDVRGIRPPTVPPGTARLRIAITLNVGMEDIARLADALGAALR